jgi:UDP-perosamine 4-acetyltransferase
MGQMSSSTPDASAALRPILLGGGGHGGVLVDALLACGIVVHGVVDRRPASEVRAKIVSLLGDDLWLRGQPASTVVLINGIGANPSTTARKEAFCRWSDAGYAFLSVIHPAATVSPGCTLGRGVQALARCVIQPGALVGDNAVVNTGAIVEHDVEIASHAFVGPGAVICGDAKVGRGAFIGAGAVVLPALRIGENAVVGAGATVVDEVPDGAVVVGTPARAQLRRRPFREAPR